MPPNQLPLTGVRAVVENLDKFLKDNDRIEKAVQRTSDRLTKTTKKAQPLEKQLDGLSEGLGRFVDQLVRSIPGGNQLLGLVGNLIPAFSSMSVAVLGAVAAIAALAIAFVNLAVRGAGIKGLATGFDIQVRRVGLSAGKLLQDLETAAAGTVSRLDLIRNANLALAGAVGEFGQRFGQELPKILEIARIQARNTGQDVNYLFNSLVTGIKRSSPLLIDNTGLVLKVGEANAKYAAEIGKSVEQLTAEEKQIALLNATLEAGERATAAFGNAQETAAEKMARSRAILSDILDTLALNVQPLFEPILDGFNGLLGMVKQLTEAFGPLIGEASRFLGMLVADSFNAIQRALKPLVDFISGLIPYITLAFQVINNVISGIRTIIEVGVQRIVEFIRTAVGIDLGFDFGTLPKRMFEGAAAVMGSFANAIIMTANQLIFPAIISIASFIRDFLMGLSPPKRGPLSTIDKGGANMMTAWLEGITGVSLQPVEQVAAQVAEVLGSIGTLTRGQIEKRFAQLDAALLPFQQRLDIITAQFEALSEPAEAALRAIDRQAEELTNRVLQGDAAAAEQLRLLEGQRALIEERLGQQQSLVDSATLQLALIRAQQAQERVLLGIRQKQLGVAQKSKSAKKSKKSGGTSQGPEIPRGGDAAIPETVGTAIEPILPGDDTSALDILSGNQNVIDAQQGIIDAFTGQIDTSQLDQLGAQSEELGGIFAEIGGIDLGEKISNKFDGIRSGIEDALNGAKTAVETKIAEIATFFTDPATPGTLPYLFQTELPTKLREAQTSIESAINTALSAFDPNVPGSPAAAVQGFINGLLDPDTEGSIPYQFGRLGVEIINKAVQVRADIQSAIDNIFDPERETSISYKAKDFVDSIINPEREGSIPDFFTRLPGNIEDALANIGASIDNAFITPIRTFFTGEGEGTLPYILNQVVTFFAELPGRIVTVLQGFGLAVYNAIVVPLVGVINGLIEAVELALQNLVQSFIDFINPLIGTLQSLGIDPGVFSSLVASLEQAKSSITFGRIVPEVPAFLQAPTQAPSTTVNNTTNNNITFNGVQGASDAVQRFSTLRART